MAGTTASHGCALTAWPCAATRRQGASAVLRATPRRQCASVTVCASAGGPQQSRRELLAAATLAAAASLLPLRASAGESREELRQRLLDTIQQKKGDGEVEAALRALAARNPTRDPAQSDKLFGRWKLLWASSNSEVSLVTRKLPVGGKSEQLVGPPGGVEQGRAANIISVAGGAVVAKLSSAAVPDERDGDVINIGPPFRLELKLGGLTIPVQSTEPGGERTQLLGNEQNRYVQLYLEDSGRPGDLRISEVTLGDPSAKGSIFVHQRI